MNFNWIIFKILYFTIYFFSDSNGN